MPDAFHVTSGSPGSNSRLVGTAGLHTVTVDTEFAVHQITQHDAVAAVEAENAVFALGSHPHQDSLDRAALPDSRAIIAQVILGVGNHPVVGDGAPDQLEV